MWKSIIVMLLVFGVFATNIYCKQYGDFVRILPDDKKPISYETKCDVSYDKDNILVNWETKVDSAFVIGQSCRDDQWVASDFLRIQVITSPSDHYSYFYCCFPNGVKYDGTRQKNLDTSVEWNSNYTYANTFANGKWYCCVKIPFKDLRYHGSAPYSWRIILSKYILSTNETYSYPYVTTNMGLDYFSSGDTLTINQSLPRQYNLHVYPYAIGLQDLKNKNTEMSLDNLGVDIGFKPNSYLGLKVAVNPDYSDVPLDDEQDVFNLEYAPYYSESRYFFIEDFDVFDIPDDLFYTRNIKQPIIAGKFTGSTEQLTYGVLIAKDKDMSGSVDSPENNWYGLATFKPKWGNFGINFSSIEKVNSIYKNSIFQVKPMLNIGKNSSLTWANYMSVYNNNTSENKKGIFSDVCYNTKIDNNSFNLEGFTYSKDFEAQMGRIYETGYYGGYFEYTYSIESKKNIDSFIFNSWINSTNYDDNTFRSRMLGLSQTLSLFNKFSQSLQVTYYTEDFQNNNYINKNVTLGLTHFKSGSYSIKTSAMVGDILLYRLAKIESQFQFTNTFSLIMGSNSDLYISWTKQIYPNLSSSEKSVMDNKYDYLNANLSYYVTNSLSVISGLRYNNYNVSIYKGHYGVFSNLAYEAIPHYTFYLGFNEGADNVSNNWETQHESVYLKLRMGLS